MTSPERSAPTLPAAPRADIDPAAAEVLRLAELHAIGPAPVVTTGARLARPGEVPAGAADLIKALAPGWRARTFHAVGPTTYAWNYKAAGHRLTASCSVRLTHSDGRAAIGIWTSDAVTSTVGAKVAKGHEGPRRPPEWRQTWAWSSGWTWTVCTCAARPGGHPDDIPRAIGATDLRNLVGEAAPALTLETAA